MFRQLGGLVNTFVRPKFLTPEWFGLWNLLNVIPAYSTYLHLGARDYLRYILPYHEARGEHEDIIQARAVVFWGAMVPNTVVALILIGFAAWGHVEMDVRAGLAAMAVIVVLTSYYEYCLTVLKGHQQFATLSNGNYLRTGSMLLLSIGLMIPFGIYGLYVAIPVSLLLVILYFRTRHRFEERIPFDGGLFIRMVKAGFPITAFAFLTTAMVTSGRLVVAGTLGNEQLGYYAISAMMLRGLLTLPGATREVVEPKMMEVRDQLRSPDTVRKYLVQPLLSSALYLPLIVGPSIFILPLFIHWVLPEYAPGIEPCQILLVGFYFLGMNYTLRGMLVGLGLTTWASLIMGVLLGVNVGLSLWLVHQGYGLNGVALGNTISYLLLYVALMWLLMVQIPGREGMKGLGQIWALMLLSMIWPGLLWLSGGHQVSDGIGSTLLFTGLAGAGPAAVLMWVSPAGERLALQRILRKLRTGSKGKPDAS